MIITAERDLESPGECRQAGTAGWDTGSCSDGRKEGPLWAGEERGQHFCCVSGVVMSSDV